MRDDGPVGRAITIAAYELALGWCERAQQASSKKRSIIAFTWSGTSS